MGIYSLFASADLEQQITSLGFKTVAVAAAILIVCTLIAVVFKKQAANFKLPLFIIMAGTLLLSTITLFGSTIYLNTKAESGGPVHWHSDIEFWACGSELEFRDPTGVLSNKIGTATYHEHNDKRIHLEGVVVRKATDASLEKFMQVTGGYITDNSIGVPLNDDPNEWFASEKNNKLDGDKQSTLNLGLIATMTKNPEDALIGELRNGTQCPNGQPAELQVFVYTFDKKANTYSQKKLAKPSDYIMREEPTVPPADCVIVEFDARKNKTDKLCQQYGVRDSKRCVEFGVRAYTPELCNAKDTTADTGTAQVPATTMPGQQFMPSSGGTQ